MNESGDAAAPPPRRAWMPVAGLVFVALAASISGITNQWAQDDFAIIGKNPAVHHLAQAWRVFAQPYWPPPFAPDLYRPLALLSYAVEWAVGGGAPLLFRVVSYVLYALSSIVVFRIARLALRFGPAFAAAALFAAHPVHVEAVAMAVNQGELWVTLLSGIAVLQYVAARRAGGAIDRRTILTIGGLYLVGCLFKENALVLPGFLVAAEWLLVPGSDSVRTRLARSRPLLLAMGLIAVSYLGLRSAVLGGDVVGTSVAEALAPYGVGGRALTMLSVVPQWFRLLFWPAHLQGDYSPAEIVAQTAWGADQTLGAALLVGAVLVGFAARRRAPGVTFGVLWCAVALFPVHNVLVPTGIVLAERTLLLPSVGAMIALGGIGALLLERAEPRARLGLAAVAGALVILGVYRSTIRHPVWSDQFNYWYVTANHDAPLSYRAHHALAEMFTLARAEGRAEAEYRLAIALAPPEVSTVYIEYANKLRLRGFCYAAAKLYRQSLAIDRENLAVRASLTACLIHLGEYREALLNTRIGISYGRRLDTWRALRQTADSALRIKAPPGSVAVPGVNLPEPPSGGTPK